MFGFLNYFFFPVNLCYKVLIGSLSKTQDLKSVPMSRDVSSECCLSEWGDGVTICQMVGASVTKHRQFTNSVFF